MIITELPIKGLLLLEPKIYSDERGYFYESFNEITQKLIGGYEFVQDNESFSKNNVLRGMHFQLPPYEQGKLVRVVTGSVIDVVIDIRKSSESYGKWYKMELSASNKKILWIPPGFAHGFLTLEDNTTFMYKCTKPYNAKSESGIIWDDPDIKIKWNTESPIVSDKDLQLPFFKNLESAF